MTKKIGLLLVNLGSPAAPSPKAVRKYLSQFLSDRRVIALHPLLWRPILHGIILRTRPKRSAAAYAKIWGTSGSEAPLIKITREQAAGVQATLGETVAVEIGMRYGKPSIEDGIAALEARGATHIRVFPLYPQYAEATTQSVYDMVERAKKKRGGRLNIKTLRDYHDHPRYIKAITASLRAHIATLDYVPDRIIASFHGLPQEVVDKGDPYADECTRSAQLMREDMGMDSDEFTLTFQSRFGPKAWLEPYTDTVLAQMAQSGLTKTVVITPGFSADCLETLEEIAIESAKAFKAAGGTHFSVAPCLNDSAQHIEMIVNITKSELFD
ncbi:MAG: ferrochelatase [Robiginitomaculum sp.]